MEFVKASTRGSRFRGGKGRGPWFTYHLLSPCSPSPKPNEPKPSSTLHNQPPTLFAMLYKLALSWCYLRICLITFSLSLSLSVALFLCLSFPFTLSMLTNVYHSLKNLSSFADLVIETHAIIFSIILSTVPNFYEYQVSYK